ncbi:MAG: hypothetical protein M3071_24265 [Actinomycetota bacterium]|nr:hypothetical protein [Actinomycetota bacterium]
MSRWRGPRGWRRAAIAIGAIWAVGALTPGAALAVSSPLSWAAPFAIDGHGVFLPSSLDFTRAVSCTGSAPTLCVVGDSSGNIISSTDPLNGVHSHGAPGWNARVSVDAPDSFDDLSCVSGPLCVGVDNARNAVASTNPSGAAASA